MRATILVSLATSVALIGAPADAQTNNLARSYTVTPKPGMYAEFETAFKAHVAWRKANGDTWTWAVYVPETGSDLNHLIVRSGGHSWADFDAYDQGFSMKALTHWMENVAPLVQSVASGISATNLEDSSLPTTMEAPAFVNVTTFHLRPGREQQFQQAVSQASTILKKGGWTNFVWSSPVSGGEGPATYLATLHSSWADMAEPDPDFATIMIKELGQEAFAKWMSDVGQTYRGTEAATYRYRPDLSLPGN